LAASAELVAFSAHESVIQADSEFLSSFLLHSARHGYQPAIAMLHKMAFNPLKRRDEETPDQVTNKKSKTAQ